MEVIFGLLLIAVPFVPGVVGIALLFRNRGDQLTRMAALLTLKPYLTTPIWGFLLVLTGEDRSPIMAVVAILPGALISAWTFSRHKNLMTGMDANFKARLLLALDCLRWLNSLFLSLFFQADPPSNRDLGSALAALTIVLGVGLPTVYALVAGGLTWRVSEKVKEKPKLKNDTSDEMDKIVEI